MRKSNRYKKATELIQLNLQLLLSGMENYYFHRNCSCWHSVAADMDWWCPPYHVISVSCSPKLSHTFKKCVKRQHFASNLLIAHFFWSFLSCCRSINFNKWRLPARYFSLLECHSWLLWLVLSQLLIKINCKIVDNCFLIWNYHRKTSNNKWPAVSCPSNWILCAVQSSAEAERSTICSQFPDNDSIISLFCLFTFYLITAWLGFLWPPAAGNCMSDLLPLNVYADLRQPAEASQTSCSRSTLLWIYGDKSNCLLASEWDRKYKCWAAAGEEILHLSLHLESLLLPPIILSNKTWRLTKQ